MKIIEKSVTVPAPLPKVWQAWTTNEGVQSFFAPDSDVELSFNGKYEIYFNHTLPYGQKGSEGCQVLGFIPERMLTFSWNAPPAIPALRASDEFTWVVVELTPEGDRTQMKLSHVVPKHGGDWDLYFAYFLRAWDIVIDRLQSSLLNGPVEWEA